MSLYYYSRKNAGPINIVFITRQLLMLLWKQPEYLRIPVDLIPLTHKYGN